MAKKQLDEKLRSELKKERLSLTAKVCIEKAAEWIVIMDETSEPRQKADASSEARAWIMAASRLDSQEAENALARLEGKKQQDNKKVDDLMSRMKKE